MSLYGVVVEISANGERLVWDFASRQERLINSAVGAVGEWVRGTGSEVSVTEALVSTSTSPINGVPGRHVLVSWVKLRVKQGSSGESMNVCVFSFECR